MEKKDVLATLNGIFAHVLKRTDITLDYSMTTNDVDGWDSITNMMIISEVEKHYGIHLKLREIIKMKDVGNLCDVILERTTGE
jgi:acyl carrier protein